MGKNYNAYDLFFSDITTPFNLLENHKLENYEYVKYYVENGLSVCEMLCYVEGVMTTFYYYFEKNALMSIEKEQYGDRETLFDRLREKEEFINERNNFAV